MRVLVCTDSIAGLSSAEAGRGLARAFRDASPDVAVAVVPAAPDGPALAAALAALGQRGPVVRCPPGAAGALDRDATSTDLGGALLAALADAPGTVVVDMTGARAPDGGAGILARLGATASGGRLDAGAAGLAGLTAVDLRAARAAVGTTRLVGVVPDEQRDDLLLGLRGLASRIGRREPTDPATMLAVDDALASLARAVGVADRPGLGAAGGAALAILALGGTITTGVGHCADVAGIERTAVQADVIVTGADAIGFADRGGPVVAHVAALAERSLRPCVAVAREVHVSARELRTFGLESAHPVGGDAHLRPDELAARAAGVARTWTW